MLLLVGWQFLDDLAVNMPVNPWYQVLMIASAGQSGCALLGFFEEDVLQLPPGRLQVELIAEEQIGFRSGPVHEIVCVFYGCRHRSTHRVPRLLPVLADGCWSMLVQGAVAGRVALH